MSTAPTFEEVTAGTRIPVFGVPLTTQRLVMEAAANRDFAPMHFDRDMAQASGAPDVFANTMLLQMLFEATIRRWTGPAGRLRRLTFKMHGFNCVGRTLLCGGTVTDKRVHDGARLVELDVWQGASPDETTVSGTAVVELGAGGGEG